MRPFALLCFSLFPIPGWSQGSHDELVARAEAAVEEALRHSQSVGLSVALAVGDEIVLAKGYGLAEVEHEVSADADTMFRIGSVTKQFTAAAIMKLYERHELELDEDITTYLESFPSRGHVVTIRHLLTHTSGIPSYTSFPEFWPTSALPATDAEMVAEWMDRDFDFEPGARWEYSNSGYYVLGMILARVAGEPWHDVVAHELLEPLGLSRTRVGSNDDVIPNRAQGYRFLDGELANDGLIDMGKPGAAGALLSTARDLVIWQLALVQGKVVTPQSYEEMTTPYMLADGRETTYGFGLSLEELGGRPAVSHGGGINGFVSFLAYLPGPRLSVAVISNCEDLDPRGVALSIVEVTAPSIEAEATAK